VIFQIIVLGIALTAIGLVFWTTIRTGSSPVPTSPSVRRTMLALLPARLPGDDEGRIYELGSGWGGMAVAFARRYPDRRVVGFELSFIPWLSSRVRLLVRPCPNLSFRLADFRNAELSDAALCICYLAGPSMDGLDEKFRRELPAGALVLSNTFALHQWQPLDTVEARDRFHSPVYLYEAPGVPGSGETG